MRALVASASAQENYVLAHDLGVKLEQSGKAEASDLNSLAWSALFIPKDHSGRCRDGEQGRANEPEQCARIAYAGLHLR
jgi:hypothetical protein